MNNHSRQLNYLFCLSALDVTEQWTKYQGTLLRFSSVPFYDLSQGAGPYWLAMQGKTYHRIFPTDRADHLALVSV